jgi:hypothetical protein
MNNQGPAMRQRVKDNKDGEMVVAKSRSQKKQYAEKLLPHEGRPYAVCGVRASFVRLHGTKLP